MPMKSDLLVNRFADRYRLKPRRVLTPAQRAQLRAATEKAALARNRQNHRARGVSEADFAQLDSQTTPRSSEEI